MIIWVCVVSLCVKFQRHFNPISGAFTPGSLVKKNPADYDLLNTEHSIKLCRVGGAQEMSGIVAQTDNVQTGDHPWTSASMLLIKSAYY